MRFTFDLGHEYILHLLSPDKAKKVENIPVWRLFIEGTPDPHNVTRGIPLLRATAATEDLSREVIKHLYNQCSSGVVASKEREIKTWVIESHRRHQEILAKENAQ